VWEGVRDNVQRAGGSAELSADGKYEKKPDVAVVVFGENPYAEGVGDLRNLLLRAEGSNHLEVLAKLKADNIPVVAVFLSGRPLWVNRELNASQAFVAAWLPGSEGDGIADVLFRKADGGIAHDFRGRLPFSWPKTGTQYALLRDRAGYDPLFAFGFGLTYQERRELPVLSEASGVQEQPEPPGTFFSGAAPTVWTPRTTGALTALAVDRATQEDSLRLIWSGAGNGAQVFTSTRGENFSFETNADMLLVLTLKVDTAPAGDFSVTAACGQGCQGAVPVANVLRALPSGQWLRLGMPLKCFAAAGADMTRPITRIELRTAGRADLTLNRLALGTDVDRRVGCAVP
jgi:beta-glucosidase